MKRVVITVDLTKEDKFSELLTALSDPKSKIISEVSADTKVIYIVETP